MTPFRWRESLTVTAPVAVLTSLVCCALPITLVALGAGSAVASLVSAAPWLVALSRHKEIVFVVAGAAMTGSYLILYRSAAPTCQPGGMCHPSHLFGRWIRRIFWTSVVLYALALGAAYLLLPITRWLAW